MFTPDPSVIEQLASTGRIRAAINFGNPVLARKVGDAGLAQGVSIDLARALGQRLGIAVDLIPFEAAGKVVEAAEIPLWDVAFLANDPARAASIAFTRPYVTLEGTYLVRDDSAHSRIDDFDRPGTRIAVGRGAAYDLYLTRTLRHAELLRAETSAGAVDLFLMQGLDCAAGVRQPLAEYARTHSGFRVIEGRFSAIEQAMATIKGRDAALNYLNEFLAIMESSGVIAQGLSRSG